MGVKWGVGRGNGRVAVVTMPQTAVHHTLHERAQVLRLGLGGDEPRQPVEVRLGNGELGCPVGVAEYLSPKTAVKTTVSGIRCHSPDS